MSQGFFKLTASSSQVAGRTTTITGCGACGLHKQCRTPRMGITGGGAKRIFILAECPSHKEDSQGEVGVGEASALLRGELRRHGIDPDVDCWKMNAVNCRLPKDQDTPTDAQIGWCHPMVWKEIEARKPHLILLLGGAAVKSLMLGRWKKNLGGIHKWRGWNIPDREVGAWICPTFHPSYIHKMNKEPVLLKIWRDDIARALCRVTDVLPKWSDERKGVHILDTPRLVTEYLSMIYAIKPRFLAFDYETTGIKLHAEGHRIVSCSMSFNGFEAGSWMWKDVDAAGLTAFRKILTDAAIGKIASNIKYEDNASTAVLGIKPQGWAWDTMLAGHVMDNRPDITSVKVLAYLHLGVLPWNEHVSHLLQSDDNGGNSFNHIDEIEPYDLLLYGGLDSIYEHQIAMMQMEATK